MKCIALIFVTLIFSSCFLFKDLKRTTFLFSENGQPHAIHAVVPKKFKKSETRTDSTGNQLRYYYYPDGAVLYFAILKDPSTQIQSIDYSQNIAKELYGSIYFKGIDSSHLFWREIKIGDYKAGYKDVNKEDEGTFDSSLNYFSLHMRH